MKIALVIDIYNNKGNGTTMSAVHYAEKLENLGHEVKILCTGEKDEVVGNKFYFKPITSPKWIYNICENQHAILSLPNKNIIIEALVDVDLVHIYLPFFLGNECAKIAKTLGKPVLSCAHISAENITFNLGVGKLELANKFAYHCLKKYHFKDDLISDIYCPSECIADMLREHGFAQNLHIISNGYNPKFRQMKIDKPDEYKDKILITSVGRFTREKRQDLIIKAIAKTKYCDRIKLVLAGKGRLKGKYERLAKKLGVDIEFKFLSQDDLIEFLNFSDLFIQASDCETEGIAALEAIACGIVPIISDSKKCATKQFALDDKSLFTQGDAISLAKKIDYWVENPQKIVAMKNNYATLALSYTLDISIQSILCVYDFIIKNKQNRTAVVSDDGMRINYNKMAKAMIC